MWQKLTDKQKDLEKKMRRVHLFEHDIKERFVHSSGPGGQNVNKVSTCVCLEHVPTGIHVKCQDYREQGRNRFYARVLLIKKLEQIQEEARLEKSYEKAKKRRAKVQRPLKLKEKILKDKHLHSQIKSSRRKIDTRYTDDL